MYQRGYAKLNHLDLEMIVDPDRAKIQTILIPPGRFIMGSPKNEEGRWENERQHLVILSKPYYMGKTPVTQAQWEAVMNTNPSYFTAVGKDAPVESVTWNECTKFCKIIGGSLPTEAQWEYACRGGTQSAYYWGTLFDLTQCNSASYWAKQVLSNYDEGKKFGFNEKWEILGARTTSVKKFPPNPFALYDILGNIWEWCQDAYADYPSSFAIDPCHQSGVYRAYRGGSWGNFATTLRSAIRTGMDPTYACHYLGFRVVVNL